MIGLRTIARVLPPPALGDALTDQAARFIEHAYATSDFAPDYLNRKALAAVAFSLRHGFRDLSVPSKLVGVAAHQPAVAALARYGTLPAIDRPRLIVSHTGRAYARQPDRSLAPIGCIQPRHLPWLLPLLGRGAALHLHAVTGLERRARGQHATLGLNVRVSSVASAVAWTVADARRRPNAHEPPPCRPALGVRIRTERLRKRPRPIALNSDDTADAHDRANGAERLSQRGDVVLSAARYGPGCQAHGTQSSLRPRAMRKRSNSRPPHAILSPERPEHGPPNRAPTGRVRGQNTALTHRR